MIRGVPRPLLLCGLGLATLAVAACASHRPAPVVYKGSVPLPAAAKPRPSMTAMAPHAVPRVPAQKPADLARDESSAPARGGKTAYRLSPGTGDGLADASAPAPIRVSALPPPAPVAVSAAPPSGASAPSVPADGRAYVVQPGDTIYSVARAFGVDTYQLAMLNGIETPFRIAVGETLRLPPAAEPTPAEQKLALVQPAPEALPQPAARPGGDVVVPMERPMPSATPDGATATAAARQPAMPVPPVRADADSFAWPVRGEIMSAFGPKPGGLHNDGINIGAPAGTPVHAAENGVVAYVGNELKGFGSMLLIRHADGWMTAYAHNQKLLVDLGDVVRRGQVVARVGSTGSVGAPQLHFELRKGATAVDPLRYLAGGVALSASRSAPADDRQDPG